MTRGRYLNCWATGRRRRSRSPTGQVFFTDFIGRLAMTSVQDRARPMFVADIEKQAVNIGFLAM
jgi:hypothetical protein